MDKSTASSVPSVIPIDLLSAFKIAIIDEHRIFLTITRLEEYYKRVYELDGKEIANWFWWAAKRHFLYRTGELKKDEWKKGGEDFEDFFQVSFFEIELREIARIPKKKYVRAYCYYRLNILIPMTINFANRDILLPLARIKKEYDFFPTWVRKGFYRDHGKKYKYTREEIEEMMSRKRLITPARVKVYQMPFQKV